MPRLLSCFSFKSQKKIQSYDKEKVMQKQSDIKNPMNYSEKQQKQIVQNATINTNSNKINQLFNIILQQQNNEDRYKIEKQFINDELDPVLFEKIQEKYLIDVEWFKLYMQHLKGNKQGYAHSIDNYKLQLKIQQKKINPFISLVENSDYYIITKDLWNLLVKLYGGFPAIKLESLEDQSRQNSSWDKNSQSTNAADSFQMQLCSQEIPLIGLQNDSFYCYFNSALQCLMNCQEFNSYFLEKQYKKINYKCQKRIQYSHFYSELLEIIIQSNGRKNTVDYIPLKRAISKMFNPQNQHDSQEFLRFFLSEILEELIPQKCQKNILFKNFEQALTYYKNSYCSIIDKLFGGVLKNQVTCLSCNYVSDMGDYFLDLSLEIIPGKTKSIYDCLKHFTQEELLIKQYKCDKCKKINKATKKLTIYSLPLYLVLHLKRFKNSYFKQKINDQIKFPTSNLDMSEYFENNKGDQNIQYNLQSIICHMGSLNGGHYVAQVKRNNQWYLCNDEDIYNSSELKVSNSQAYILFYKKLI